MKYTFHEWWEYFTENKEIKKVDVFDMLMDWKEERNEEMRLQSVIFKAYQNAKRRNGGEEISENEPLV